VGKHDDEHLRRFLKARAAGDAREMRRWWEELIIDFRDRMDALVQLEHRGRLDDDEHEVAVQLAMIRFGTRLMHTFDGVSMGELVNACKTMAGRNCIDVQRQSMAARRHGSVSLDEGWDAPDDAAPAWDAREARRRHSAEERARELAGFLEWALPQLSDKHRPVVEMSFQGATVPEICAQLGIERDNAYQRRSRGLKDLSKLKERYDA
jgi:DNA-directed RNA polymerase specialized sigma24 family protein